MSEEDSEFKLVEDVDEYVSTDIISDIKSGIYNLFVSLVDYYTIDFGPVKGPDEACKFLERLVDTVRDALEETNNN